MDLLQTILSSFPKLSPEQLSTLIALGGLAMAAFVIYLVLSVIRELMLSVIKELKRRS